MKGKTVAEFLVELRKNHRYTQSDLADQLGVTFQAVSKWERGENLPDAYTIVDLARIYSITVDEILNGELVKRELSPKPQKRKGLIIAIAVGMLILAPTSVILLGVTNWNVYVPIILVVISLSVMMIIYASLNGEKRKEVPEISKEQKRKEEIIYAICAGIFLILGLGFQLFHIAWIVFIFGYAATLIIKK